MRRFAEKEGAQEGVRLVWRSGSRARRVSARQWSFVILFPLFDPQFQPERKMWAFIQASLSKQLSDTAPEG